MEKDLLEKLATIDGKLIAIKDILTEVVLILIKKGILQKKEIEEMLLNLK